MRQIRTKNAASIIPVYKQLRNTNTLFLDTLALQLFYLSAILLILWHRTVCHNINKTVVTKYDKACDFFILWHFDEL